MTFLELLGMVLLAVFTLWIGYLIGKAVMKSRLQEDVVEIRKDAVKRSRAVLTGQISEQLAPFLPDFPWKPSEARFIGKPIDFLIFEGMDEKEITEVVFVEVKSGGSRLSGVERSLRDAIEQKRVRWEEYRVPKSKTK
jgi:predicted Holliday junction resolvase-like endonuclease